MDDLAEANQQRAVDLYSALMQGPIQDTAKFILENSLDMPRAQSLYRQDKCFIDCGMKDMMYAQRILFNGKTLYRHGEEFLTIEFIDFLVGIGVSEYKD